MVTGSIRDTLPLDGQRWLDTITQARHDPVTLLDSLEGGYVLGLALAVAMPIVRAALDASIYKPLGRKFLPHSGKSTVRSHHAGLTTRMFKWQESFWKATVYTVFFSIALRGSIYERFFYDTKYFWIGCNRFPPCNYDVPRLVRLLYAAEFAYYLQGVPYLILFEVKRRDFWENVCHHIATLGLIVYSYQLNFMKVGTMVFLCHDVTDIFMETAKLFGYIERKRTSTGLFVFFVILWFGARIIYFPLWVIRSVWYEPIEVVAKVYNLDPHPHHEIFLALLSVLFALHLYWTVLIVKVAVTAVLGDIKDVRETDAHADDPPEAEKLKAT